jgi:Predicted exporters of the RND superfamily
MSDIKNKIVGHPKIIIVIFLILAVTCGILALGVKVNTDNSTYLPHQSNAKQAMEKLSDEFGMRGNAYVLLKSKTVSSVMDTIKKMENVNGVKSVVWLDDYVDVNKPVEFIDKAMLNRFYKDGNALLTVLFQKGNDDEITYKALDEMGRIVGDSGQISGPAAISRNTVQRTNNEIPIYMGIAIILILIILFSTTTSWIEPVFFLAAIGVAIILNMGTNIFKGEISQTTFAAASLLQLAVSMDYSIFLLHRFHEERAKGIEVKQAMMNSMALSFKTILASGLTTFAGFMALMFMNFGVGMDMGVVLVKGIVLSLISVFVLLPALVVVFDKWIERFTHRELNLKLVRISKFTTRFRYVTVIIMVAIAALFFMAQAKTEYYYSIEKMLPSNDKAIMAEKETASIFGPSNQSMLLVPLGDNDRESALVSKLESLPGVKNVTGIYKQLGLGIPEHMLPDNVRKMFISDHYSMITFDISYEKESKQAFETVNKVRELTSGYYKEWYASGESFVYKDMKDITDRDFLVTNLLSIAFIFLILLLTFKSVTIPVIAVLVIEMAIWINVGFAYFSGEPMNFLSCIVIGAIQLGATVDYAILFIGRYRENLDNLRPVPAAQKAIQDTAKSILTSGGIVVVATFSVFYIATITAASEMCLLIGRGALISMFCVLFVLPGFLILFNRVIRKTTIGWP